MNASMAWRNSAVLWALRPRKAPAGQNAEPNFHLIQPTGRGGGEVKMDVGMLGQPGVALLVRAVIVQDYMQFLLGQGLLHNLIHKLQKLLPPLALCECRFDFSRPHPQGGKQVERPLALVSALVSAYDLSVVGFHVAGLSFQGLDTGFFVHRDHHRFLGGIEVQPHNVGRFGRKLFVGANAPRALPLQADPLLAQHPPHRMHRTLERRRHRGAVPASLTRRGRLFQQGQDPLAKILAINPLRARSRRIAQPRQTLLRKTLSPLDDGVGTSVASASDFFHPLTRQTAQNDLRSFYQESRFGPTPGQPCQFSPVFRSTTYCGRTPCHARHYTIYRLSLQVSTSTPVWYDSWPSLELMLNCLPFDFHASLERNRRIGGKPRP